MKKPIFAAIASACIINAAQAADLPSRYAPPLYGGPPIFTWTGFYAGLNGGLGFGGFTHGGGTYFGSAVGGLIGGTVGYNYQSGSLLVGAEGDLDFAGVGGGNNPRGGVSGYGTMTSMGTIRARFGYAAERALVYVTGGYAGATVQGNLSDAVSSPHYVVGESNYLNGYAIGGGVEYAFTPNISAKAEYLFSSFATHGYFGGTPDALDSGLRVSTIRAGVNYHF